MNHQMSLHLLPFERMQKGEKIYELRLNDEKRQLLQVGDEITFTCRENGDTLCAKVVSLLPFKSFSALYQTLDLRLCGYREGEIFTASPKDMEAYYSQEEIERWGVLAIKIKLI